MTKKAVVLELYNQGITSQKELVLKTGFKYNTVAKCLWKIRHPDVAKAYNKVYNADWCKNNKEKVQQSIKKCYNQHQQATLAKARNHGQEWTTREIKYLEDHGQVKSIRQIAEDLGRTYKGVKRAGDRFGINMRGKKTGGQFVGAYSNNEVNKTSEEA